ncbi:hypothetical protein CYY_005692 [Polysphondylium violaceum]|uniref:Carbohydrate binding domain-containing protein n=1 Tax=Polysphondylium violaceum TaxID=133409 RepID=A0A8J4PTT2_9MYCE|nr:hypothetical protein CYY_005692 [Polysphondylium violaceum]
MKYFVVLLLITLAAVNICEATANAFLYKRNENGSYVLQSKAFDPLESGNSFTHTFANANISSYQDFSIEFSDSSNYGKAITIAFDAVDGKGKNINQNFKLKYDGEKIPFPAGVRISVCIPYESTQFFGIALDEDIRTQTIVMSIEKADRTCSYLPVPRYSYKIYNSSSIIKPTFSIIVFIAIVMFTFLF